MTLSLFLGLGRPPSREEDTFRFFFVRVREGEREGETTTVDETRAKERAEREIRALYSSKEGLVCVEKRGRRRPLEW